MARRPTGRGRAPKKQSNPLPLIVVGGIVLAAVIGFIAMSSGDEEQTPTDTSTAASSSGSSGGGSSVTPKKPTGKLYDGKTKSEWAALKKKVDMTAWDTVDDLMADAKKKLAEALRLRDSGDEAGFKREIQTALKAHDKTNAAFQDFLYVVEAVDEDLWVTDAKMFRSEDAAITKFRKKFRGYLQFQKK